MFEKYGLVCPTMCLGLTMTKDDIYDTKGEALAELKEMSHAWFEIFEFDEDANIGFEVRKIVQQSDGSWEDCFGEKITMIKVNL